MAATHWTGHSRGGHAAAHLKNIPFQNLCWKTLQEPIAASVLPPSADTRAHSQAPMSLLNFVFEDSGTQCQYVRVIFGTRTGFARALLDAAHFSLFCGGPAHDFQSGNQFTQFWKVARKRPSHIWRTRSAAQHGETMFSCSHRSDLRPSRSHVHLWMLHTLSPHVSFFTYGHVILTVDTTFFCVAGLVQPLHVWGGWLKNPTESTVCCGWIFHVFFTNLQAGIRRGSYKGVVPFAWNGQAAYLVRNWPLN